MSTLNIGNSGEIINLADNEILPIFDKYIGANRTKIFQSKHFIKHGCKTYLILANALIFQGNSRAFEVLSTLFELFRKNNFEDNPYL